MYPRFIRNKVEEALADTPVVLVVGPRRSGKTTLVRQISGGDRRYLTLDDQTTLDLASADPVGFVQGLDRVIIDEIQRVPELMLAIKRAVDEDYRPGRFLLTGSANVMTLPRVADSLAGRMETIRLLPLSRSELSATRVGFLEACFDGTLAAPSETVSRSDLADLAVRGGFPEALERDTERRRHAWANAYIESVLTRDLRDIVEVERLTDLPRFVRVLAEHAGQLVNYTAIGSAIDITYKTSQRYLGLLGQIFLVSTLQPWYSSSLKRLVKTPKLHFLDAGLLAAIRGVTLERLHSDPQLFGPLLETFVHAEIRKMATWYEGRLDLFHFRDWEKNEVDVVLERGDGRIVGIEVKASATVRPGDFKGLRKLAGAAGDRFAGGVLLHGGPSFNPVSPGLVAAPVSCLWSEP